MFPSTRHTLLREAVEPEGRQALEAMAQMYWQPCLRYMMVRWRLSREEAEDAVQGFFAVLLEEELLGRYEAVRGPFRPWLRACLDGFVRKGFEKQSAAKRGGRVLLEALDDEGSVGSGGLTPEQIFHQEWQREMFALAASDLRAECEGAGRLDWYELFAAYDLAEESRPGYEELAVRFGVPVTTVTNRLAWVRRELRRLLEVRVGKRDMRNLVTGRR